ncbi:MAG: imelysin family protein [Dinoroseobacter sp.]|nr:imelysin family protein [Dinoroseobacter sp.]
MLKPTILCLSLSLPSIAIAQDVGSIVDTHILPGYQSLAAKTQILSTTAQQECTPSSATLQSAYHDAFDAWVSVSHLRFGPSETEDRAFALAFWPDPRGSTPKTLAGLIADADPVIETSEAFRTVSVAGRGFYALEFLLFDPAFVDMGSPEYRCALIQAVLTDIADNSAAILEDWTDRYADLMRNAGENGTYRSEEEALRQLFTALSTGLEFTSSARLGRPLGTFDRPKPKRAEARRSERSLRHVVLSLEATRALADLMSDENPELDAAFVKALKRAETVDDPSFSGVAELQGRLRVEVLQQQVDLIRQKVAEDLGTSLGIAAGFNSLDGD